MPVVVSAPVSTQPWIARSIERGAQLAVDEINADGGVQLKGGPRKLKLVVMDNGSSPATALANAREAVERNAAALLTDGTGAVSVASVTDPAKLPVFVALRGWSEADRPRRAPVAVPPRAGRRDHDPPPGRLHRQLRARRSRC